MMLSGVVHCGSVWGGGLKKARDTGNVYTNDRGNQGKKKKAFSQGAKMKRGQTGPILNTGQKR